jgi:DMSO/TMAO reductase YedYZ molybdopterin-dependent catalytic subunit
VSTETKTQLPPGQVWGKKFVIYGALGIPTIDITKWKLTIVGLVEKPLEYSYQELNSLPMKQYAKPFHCLLPNSIVYANPEPIEISKLRYGDLIIGADGRRHRIKRLIRRIHKGWVIGVKPSYLPAAVMTPEHPVLAVRGDLGEGRSKSKRKLRTFRGGFLAEWMRADQLRIGDYVFFPKYSSISKVSHVSYGKSRFGLGEEFAYMLGWYVAEGSGASSDPRNIAFSLNMAEEKHVENLRRILATTFGAKISGYSNRARSLSKIVVTSSKFPKLAPMLKSWCGSEAQTKKIPDFIINARPRILKQFLVGYFEGDGYSPVLRGKTDRRSDFIDLTTSSRVLAYQLVLALSKIGIAAGIVDLPGSVRLRYSVRVRGPQVRKLLPWFPDHQKINKSWYWETDAGFYYPIRKIWKEEYQGEVHDFQARGFTMLSPFATQDCVTRWGIMDARWEGVPIAYFAKQAGVRPDSQWVMFRCTDGYSAPVPIEDATNEDSIVAIKLNGHPLTVQQGYPARPFFPNLYGWKSAKWLTSIEFLSEYKDGFWEMYGYHERGNIWAEERFKGGFGKHAKRTAFGAAG